MHDLKTWDGCPDASEISGWHWIEDGDGLRPLLWRGEDWPDPIDRGEWQDGYAVLSADDLSHGRYHGPVTMSAYMTALCRAKLLAPSFQPEDYWGQR